MHTTTGQRKTGSLRLALLGLLAVVGSQLTLAEHQFQHDAGIADEVCAVCLQVEQLDVPQPAAPDSAAPAARPGPLPEPQRDPVASGPALHYASRAPPLSG